MKRFDCHTHTHKSNIQHRDSTNFESKLIDRAIELGLKGIAITDHAVLSGHVDAILHLKKIRKEAKEAVSNSPYDLVSLDRLNKVENFKLGLGTEIYLVDREIINKARENNEPTKFYHLILVAKNYDGYRALAELSSNSWEEAFTFRGVMRTPTYKDYFIKWAERNAGNIIVTTACLGSEFSQLVLNYIQNPTEENRQLISNFVLYFKNTFQDDFYIEIQPSHFEEQIAYNKLAIQIAEHYGIKVVIDTDAHYDSNEMREIHSIYLKSQNAERETEQFYASAYLMDVEELRSYFEYVDDIQFNEYMKNSLEIADKIEEFDLYRETEVPKTTIQFDANGQSILAPLVLSTTKYPYIVKYGTSPEVIDRTLLQQIEEGLIEKNINIDDVVLSRLNVELEALWEVSTGLNQRMASYYLLTKEIVELMWKVSLVGVSRGSAGSFYICYLLGITQINPIQYNLDYWRHIDKNKIELADIDIDTEAGQRANILELVKEKYGHNRVLNICTFKTEGTASAIQTMCRGMGISIEEAQYISSLAPDGMTVKKCLELYEKDKEATTLIKEMMNYEGLIENVIAIEGLVCGRSVHASGIYVYGTEYWNRNAMMRTPKGQMVTQYDMKCSDYQGGLKLDFLTVEALDRIRKDMELLVEDKIFEWQGSLKKTYDKYIHPDVLDLEDKEMWDNLCQGKILDAFQMDSPVGKSSIAKVQPYSFYQVCDTNALMRISCEGKQPIDRYNDNKKDIDNWYKEMKGAGLTQDEVRVMEKHLLKNYGVASTQEQAMKLSMDKAIANFTLVEANKLRKAIAKSYAKDMISDVYNKFIGKGIENGNRQGFLEYVWESCIVPMLGYSFSEPHIYGYSLILIQELNLYKISSLHWKVACLCVNAGDINDDVSKATDYGALAKAIGNMEKGFIQPPSINKSSIGFKANMKRNTALYGLGAINGISNDLAKSIIRLRPFTSFQDFIDRAVETKVVQPSKVYNLIKAGCFNEFNDRIKIMCEFINYVVPSKNKLTLANIPKMIEYRCIPDRFADSVWLYNFKKYVFNKNNISILDSNLKDIYKIPFDAIDYFNKNLAVYFEEATDYDYEGNLVLNMKIFNKTYRNLIKEFEDWLRSTEALNLMNHCCKNEVWMKYCSGSLAKWDMDSLSYYTDSHELDVIDISKFYSIDNFNDLPRVPESYEVIDNRTGRKFRKNNLSIIAGTVVEKNKTKSIITLNTQYGVVEVKFYKSSFTDLDRKTEEEPSWFGKGTKLIIVGFRRGESFIPKIYANSSFKSSVMRIEQTGVNKIDIRMEKK